jgi:hypothetical protein
MSPRKISVCRASNPKLVENFACHPCATFGIFQLSFCSWSGSGILPTLRARLHFTDNRGVVLASRLKKILLSLEERDEYITRCIHVLLRHRGSL